jgi:ATP-dependent helicase/nuclease subunit A
MTGCAADPPGAAAGAAQNRASDPAVSVWVSANAGSGKTRVLIDRVTRLLIRGADPRHILCLTYTRAAAAEMQKRLFARLGEWAMLPDDALRAELAALDEPVTDLAPARRLFAQALEVPGGLKIETIHAFCAAVLRRFPLEAGVPPGFREIEAREAARLRADAMEALATDSPELCDALFAVDPRAPTDTLTVEILRNRDRFAEPADAATIWRGFDLIPGDGLARLWEDVVAPGDADLLARVARALRGGGTTDARAAARLAAAGFDTASGAEPPSDPAEIDRRLTTLEGVLLYGAGAKAGPFSPKIGAFPTKASREVLGHDLAPLEALMPRVAAGRPRRLALAAAGAALALDRFAGAFLAAYDARKAAYGALDFDDLIAGVRALLDHSPAAQWVLWKLDGGLDHILIDEAQDTSPAQWAVVRRLAEEFMAGAGAARRGPRTLFAVGDEKQSIYSFQGADPAGFGATRAHFRQRLDGHGGTRLIEGRLRFSFRSAPAILRAVDAVFGAATPGVPQAGPHLAFHRDRPGRVDWWPLVATEAEAEAPDWSVPVALRPGAAAQTRLARGIADTIAGWLAAGARIDTGRPGDPRPIGPGDLMILVQRRGEIFRALIAALKARGLPLAGADRLRLDAELAVRDLTALLTFLATPEDDLALAACLRSPLFGLSEAALFRLAHGRAGTMWEALRAMPDHADTVAMLRDLRAHAGFLRPYELLERILIRHDGRARLVGRLGAESVDGIDALLGQALIWERSGLGDLTGFLGWLAAGDVEIKREMEGAGGRIRVMTVHGAKGLQAPVVILPDSVRKPPAPRDRVLALPGGGAALRTAGSAEAARLVEAVEDRRARDSAERARLLYVAMTRAEAWLIVAGAGQAALAANDWHGKVADGLRGLADAGGNGTAIALDTPVGPGLRLEGGDWPEADVPAAAALPATSPTAMRPLPDWATAPAPPEARPAQPISPSDLGGAKALPGEDGAEAAAAQARGIALHRLLEHLPTAGADATGLAARVLAPWPAAQRATLLAEAQAVLADPALAPLFAPGTLAEVGIVLPGAPPLQGQIDRLRVEPGRVLAVDFKSHRTVPATAERTPAGILQQMAAYRHALRRVYPDHAVEMAILWTRLPRLVMLGDGLLDRAVPPGLP